MEEKRPFGIDRQPIQAHVSAQRDFSQLYLCERGVGTKVDLVLAGIFDKMAGEGNKISLGLIRGEIATVFFLLCCGHPTPIGSLRIFEH